MLPVSSSVAAVRAVSSSSASVSSFAALISAAASASRFSCPSTSQIIVAHRFCSSTTPSKSQQSQQQQQQQQEQQQQSTTPPPSPQSEPQDANGLPPQHDLPPQQDIPPDGKIEEGKVQEPLWPDCDTVDEILDEEKFGDQKNQPPMQPEHVLTAFKAFVYGTIVAFVGVGLIAYGMMQACGFYTIEDVLRHVSEKDKRRMDELRAKGDEVIEFSFDLSRPNEIPEQFSALWQQILTTAGVDLEQEDGSADAKKSAAAATKAK